MGKITDKELDKLVNNKSLLTFEWPPKFRYPFKKQRHYTHNIVVISKSNPDAGYVLTFTSERKARAAKSSMQQCTNDVTIDYDKRELPILEEEGYITQ